MEFRPTKPPLHSAHALHFEVLIPLQVWYVTSTVSRILAKKIRLAPRITTMKTSPTRVQTPKNPVHCRYYFTHRFLPSYLPSSPSSFSRKSARSCSCTVLFFPSVPSYCNLMRDPLRPSSAVWPVFHEGQCPLPFLVKVRLCVSCAWPIVWAYRFLPQ